MIEIFFRIIWGNGGKKLNSHAGRWRVLSVAWADPSRGRTVGRRTQEKVGDFLFGVKKIFNWGVVPRTSIIHL